MQDREEKTEQQLQESIKAADEQPILISDACKQLNMRLMCFDTGRRSLVFLS